MSRKLTIHTFKWPPILTLSQFSAVAWRLRAMRGVFFKSEYEGETTIVNIGTGCISIVYLCKYMPIKIKIGLAKIKTMSFSIN